MNIQTIFIVLYETFLVFTNAAIDRYFFSIGFHDFRGIMTKSEKHQHDFILKSKSEKHQHDFILKSKSEKHQHDFILKTF